MGFGQAVYAGFHNYFNFDGRTARPEYWWFVLFLVTVGLMTAVIDLKLLRVDPDIIGPFYAIFTLTTFIPALAASARRFHDMDRTAWWLLLIFLPPLGFVILAIWLCQPGTAGPNRFGSPPATPPFPPAAP